MIKRVALWLVLFIFSYQLHAQQVFFIYIQSENRKPFYARMNGKVISSTAGGYLLMPKLQNGGYRAAIGFPGKTADAEEEFLFTIDNNDLGYDLKEQPGGGHILFNILSYKIENPVSAGGTKKEGGNTYGDLLADVVKDPTVKNIDPVKPAEKPKPKEEIVPPPVVEMPKPKEETVPPPDTLKTMPAVQPTPVQNDPPMMVKTQPVTETPKVREEPKAQEPPKITGAVKILFQANDKDGKGMVFVDGTNGSNDTVRIFVPRLPGDTLTAVETKPVVMEMPKEEPVKPKEEAVTPPVVTAPPAEPKKDSPFLNIEVKNPNTGVQPGTVDTLNKPKPQPKLVMVNTDCKKIADESDFIKLRTKMAGEKSNEEMMSVAIKSFRQRCYTTEQVKSLSVLLTGDDGKYRFYELAYPFVYDTANFALLEQQLTDEYFKNRFRTLVKKN